ncbi:MAG: T9SS type A sorting domain-containing protein [Ignavibacteria bacterium]|nr:T9SS type A sorting domain-containing protein [Ignavibacteria bacterium]
MKTKNNLCLTILTVLLFLFLPQFIQAQPWEEDNHIFNPTGIPSLSFSQPRFYDLDNDGDLDMILGSTVQAPLYFKNTGSKTTPKFVMDKSLFANVNSLNAEMGVCVDIDADGDLDFVTGGYTGLHLYENIGSNMQPEFMESTNIFAQLSVGENPIPTLADMDGDGDIDLAVGLSEDGGVKYYTNSGLKDSPEFLESNGVRWFDVGLYAYPYFVDLDKDGDTDLLVGRDGFGIKYYENIGDSLTYNWSDKSSLFQTVGTTTYWNSGALVDLSGDGKTDLVFGSASGQIFYYTNTGTNVAPTWKENTTVFGGTIDIGGASSPLLYDYDADGGLDMFTGTQLGNIKYFENVGTANNPAWKENSAFLTNVKHSIYSAAAVGDLNNDGKQDLIVGDFTGKLYLHMQTASGFPAVTTAMNIVVDGFAVPRLIDFDKDNDLDLIIGRDNGTISFYENIGTAESADWLELQNFFGSIDVGGDAVPSLVDYDKDGDYDLIAGNISGEVKFFYNNTFDWIEDTSVTSTIIVDQNAAPACADLDGDGDFDLVLGNYEGTFSYYKNQNPTDIKRESIAPTDFSLSQNYPNPFNPVTVIKYSIPVVETGHAPSLQMVSLIVYDVLGNEVATLVNENQSEGTHQVEFQSAVGSKQLASGVYFYQLRSSFEGGNFVQTKKFILMK